MSENETYQLPTGWTFAKLDDLIGNGGLFMDGDWIESKDQDPNGEVRLIQLADIGDGNFKDKSNRFMTYERAIELNCTFLERGDILIARMPEPLGRAAIFPFNEKHKYVTVVDVAVVRTGSGVYNKYLMFFLNSPEIRRTINSLQTGTTRSRISRRGLSTIEIPVPPFKEQVRIVEKIEEIFSELDNSLISFQYALNQLKTYRSTVLKEAFNGKITEKWRLLNKPEHGKKVLQNIEVVKTEIYKQNYQQWEKAHKIWKGDNKTSLRPIKPKKPKIVNELSEMELLNLPELPKEWQWTKLGVIAEITGGIAKGKKYSDIKLSEVPYLSVSNVQDGFLDLLKVKTINATDEEIVKYQLLYGDILYTEGGDKDKLGRGTIWRNEIDSCIHQNHIFRARKISNDINPLFCSLYSNTRYAKDYFYRHAKQTTNLASINLSVLSNLPFPMLTTIEQDKIVSYIESQFSIIDHLHKSVTTGIEELHTLKTSILNHAFCGKLVPQDIEDEGATQFLHSIHQEYKHTKSPKVNKPIKKQLMNQEGMDIIEILKANGPMTAKAVWEQSKFRGDIEGFYSELKKIKDLIKEAEKGILSLAHEN